MKNFKLDSAKNGYILTDPEGEKIVVVDSDNEGDEVERFAEFLHYLNDQYGPEQGRYSEKRIYITIAPGDKHDNNDVCHWCDRPYTGFDDEEE